MNDEEWARLDDRYRRTMATAVPVEAVVYCGDIARLRAENERLRGLLEIAANACRERAITPHLIDVLDAEGYETAPPAPEPEVWLPRDHEN